MRRIHPTAVVDTHARLGADVEIGANCYVGPEVVLGDRCRLHNNVTITGRTEIGPDNVFFPGAVIGAIPQDLKYRGGSTRAIIGSDNVFREQVTVHAGTETGAGVTEIGDHGRFLVGVHIAHDAHIGSDCILSNYVQVAGHAWVEDRVNIGALTGVHQFATVGEMAFLSGYCQASSDVPPYLICDGAPARPRGVNAEGMRRWGWEAEAIQRMRDVYRKLFSRRAGQTMSLLERIEALESNGQLDDRVRYLCEFIRRSSDDGVFGRYREAARRDTPDDRAAFYNRAEHQPEDPSRSEPESTPEPTGEQADE